MFLGLSIFTWVHTLLSLVGIASGLMVVKGLLSSQRLDGWTALFLASAVATSVTGFFLPADHFGPAHWVGVISLVALAFAILARYGLHLAGAWRWIYAVGAVLALYFLVFVGVAQLFAKVPALHALAPTQAEPPFASRRAWYWCCSSCSRWRRRSSFAPRRPSAPLTYTRPTACRMLPAK